MNKDPDSHDVLSPTAGSTNSSELPDYMPALDGIRAVAIILVLMHNSNILKEPGDVLGVIVSHLAGVGWVGVQLFFVLSGFLISRNLLKLQNSKEYFKIFYGRRILRIFPLYYTTLIFFFLILPLTGYVPQAFIDDAPHQIWLWVFLSNWTEFQGMGGISLSHFWSLAVEEQFYFIWPFVLHRRSAKQVLTICLIVAFASLLLRCLMVIESVSPMTIYVSSLTRMDALALGAAVAAWSHLPEGPAKMIQYQWKMVWLAAGLILVARSIPKGLGMTDSMGQTIGYSILAVAFALLIAAIAARQSFPGRRGEIPFLSTSGLRRVAKYSFGMYIFHLPLSTYVGLVWMENWGLLKHPSTLHGIAYIAAVSLITFALACASYELMEKHFLKLKKYFPEKL